MAYTVNLYYFSKKVNSTARPTAEPIAYSCVIKEPCGIVNPTIGLNLGLASAPTSNYAYIPAFGRYYYVREWTFENALWYASLEVDVLASWKEQIGASNCYVLRSSQLYDGSICDTTYPATGNTTLDETQGISPWETEDMSEGVYVVGIAGKTTTYYIFSDESLDEFFNALFSDWYANQLTDGWSEVYVQLKAQTNPLQYITSIMWMPFWTLGTAVSSIRVGWVDVPVAAGRVDGSGLRYGQTDFVVHDHPQLSRGTYLKNAPFSNYMLFYPPWGTIQLDPDIMANTSSISAIWGVDLRTGQGTLTVAAGEAHIMSWIHAQVGVPYQVSQVINRGYGAADISQGILSMGANIIAKNPIGTISTGISEIGNFAAAKIPSATTIGSNGGLDSLRGLPALQYEWKEIVSEDLAHRGRPLCQNKDIGTMTGYILVADADINLSATKEEQDSVRNYMEGGFFYE